MTGSGILTMFTGKKMGIFQCTSFPLHAPMRYTVKKKETFEIIESQDHFPVCSRDEIELTKDNLSH